MKKKKRWTSVAARTGWLAFAAMLALTPPPAARAQPWPQNPGMAPPPGAPPPAQTSVCARLEAQLSALERGAADPVRGKTVYARACASCHGADGLGVLRNPSLPAFGSERPNAAIASPRATRGR